MPYDDKTTSRSWLGALDKVPRENLARRHFDAAKDAAKVSGQRDDEDRY